MWKDTLEGMRAGESKICTKLNEVMSLSAELSDAVEREDQASVGMILAARRKAVFELQECYTQRNLRRYVLSREERERLDSLLKEEDEPLSVEEQRFFLLVSSNRRLLGKLTELDRRVNIRLCKERSVYLKQQGEQRSPR